LAFLILAVTFIAGFDPILMPFIPLTLIYRGLGVGTALAAIVSTGSVQSITSILLIVPFAVFAGVVLAVACREAMRLSVSIFKVTTAQGGAYAPIDYRLYVNKFILLSALMLVGSFADGFLTILFDKFISII
jgi:hypothetical protein